ncbi:ABC transporter ATP-binding protein [Dactylosporangium sp. AC04546]|uniref:ABC transporter ATP-binding protein n=1 Tax=Dactylosporangium sp. AC04546 TaxID=2862460 RepID=UPI001EDCD4C4|nr:ABC transporter ATP-binding protein [Dactylosporangium sp. AC04546]WVK88001.1 ABC transporter ATP-binding protein [Dactylosporangium sp. AC04546]
MIEVEGLVKRYGKRTALDGVDLRAAPGEVLAVLGPNGAGKTSLVEILEGYRPRDGGRVQVLGTDPARPTRAWRGRIGVLPQSTSVDPQLTVGEAVGLFSRLYRDPWPSGDLLDRLGLADAVHRRAGVLSGGRQRRLDLALALVGRPEVLFLDEPTTGFDPEARRDTWRVVREVAAGGCAVLLTTHYLEEAAELADRVVVVVGGKIVADGDPATLGGHLDAETTIRYRPPGGEPAVIRTRTPSAALLTVLREGEELGELSVTRPTLEDAYLSLVGSRHAA